MTDATDPGPSTAPIQGRVTFAGNLPLSNAIYFGAPNSQAHPPAFSPDGDEPS